METSLKMGLALGRGALQLEAMRAVLADPLAAAHLSPPARLMLSTAVTAVETVTGTSLTELGTQALEGLGGMLSDVAAGVIGEVIGDVLGSFPIFGVVAKMLVGLISGAMAGPTPEQRDAAYCQWLWKTFPIVGSGSTLGGGEVVPADIFARRIPLPPPQKGTAWDGLAMRDLWWNGASPLLLKPLDRSAGPRPSPSTLGAYRSALGMALMTITEGVPIDWHDVDVHATLRAYKKSDTNDLWRGALKAMNAGRDLKTEDDVYRVFNARRIIEAARARYPGVLVALGQKPDPAQQYGVPKRYQILFRKLRRAIEASHASQLRPGETSDGGMSLWGAYLDLLRLCYAEGYLSDAYVRFLLGRSGLFGGGWFTSELDPKETYCWRQSAQNVTSLIQRWEQSIHPSYQQGQAKLREIEAQVTSFAREATQQRAAARGLVLPGTPAPHAEASPTILADASPPATRATTDTSTSSGARAAPVMTLGLVALAALAAVAVLAGRPPPPPLPGNLP